MSKYDYVTVKCTQCGVRITGKRALATGEVHAARQPKNDAPVIDGLCMPCKKRSKHILGGCDGNAR